MGLRESSGWAAEANRMRVLRELVSGQGTSFVVSKRQEIRDRVAIFALRRKSAKTWRNTSLSDNRSYFAYRANLRTANYPTW